MQWLTDIAETKQIRMSKNYSDLDPRRELEQTVASDLDRALAKRGAIVKHHGTPASHAPSTAPADITVEWGKGKSKNVLLVEVALRSDESEFTPLVEHLERAILLFPGASVNVLYAGRSTSTRMARFIRNFNKERFEKGKPGRIVYLALNYLQEFLEPIHIEASGLNAAV